MRIQLLNRKDNEDYIKAFAVFNQFFLLMLQLLVYKLLGVNENNIVHGIILLLCALPVLYTSLLWLKHDLNVLLCFFSLIAITIFVQFLFFNENVEYLRAVSFYFLLICIPCCINIMTIDDETKMLVVFEKVSARIAITGLLFFVVNTLAVRYYGNTEYYMAFSYYMLWPALLFQYKYFSSNKFKYLVFSGVILITMTLIGSRGALLVWVIYFVLGLFLSKKNVPSHWLLTIAIVFICFAKNQILHMMTSILLKLGVNSRSVMLLSNHKFLSHDSGRLIIFKESMNAIHDHPFIGNGIAANYRLYNGFPHNLVIELVLNFGWIMGLLLVFIICYMLVTAYRNTSNKLFYLLFVCAGLIPIMFSGTYLTDVSFWIFIGFSLRLQKIKLHLNIEGRNNDDSKEKNTKHIANYLA